MVPSEYLEIVVTKHRSDPLRREPRCAGFGIISITNPKRSEVYPEFPTIGETIPGYELITWAGFAVPGAVRAEWVKKLSTDAMTAMGAPEVRRRLVDSGLEPAPQPASEFQAFLRSETERWGKIVRDVNFKLD